MVLFSGFLLGFIVDSFYNTWGIHSAACVFIAFIRPFVLKVVTPKNAGDDNDLKEKSLLRFSLYAIILIFIHHSIIFFIEIAHFKLFFRTLVKIFFSTIFTFVLSVIIQYLSPRKATKQA
jgi:positive regulator of sigma E activity